MRWRSQIGERRTVMRFAFRRRLLFRQYATAMEPPMWVWLEPVAVEQEHDGYGWQTREVCFTRKEAK